VGANPRSGVLLDRDGVLNDVILRGGRSYPPESVEALRILPDVPAALALLKGCGLPLIVVTNQPDVGSGKQSLEVVEAIHDHLRAALPLDSIEVCFHTDADDCACRKPRTGMLEAAARRHGIDLRASYLVGDRWRDIEAGQRVGCTTFWIDRGYSEKQPSSPDYRVSTLLEASRQILELRAPDATSNAGQSPTSASNPTERPTREYSE